MKLLPSSLRSLFRVNLPDGKIRKEAYDEITQSLTRAFDLPSLKTYAATLSIKGLLVKSVELFVGSRDIPKNVNLSRYLLKVALGKAQEQSVKDEIEYYMTFCVRMEAFKHGKATEFDLTTQALNRLAEDRNHPQSCYLVGKQLFNSASQTKDREERKQFYKLAAFFFEKSLSESQYGGLYYLGEILRMKDLISAEEDESMDYFVYGAALGDPLCYFRIARIHHEKEETAQYLKYLKLAAESGVLEAQHNLACQYLEGNNLSKNQVKALSWFLHASAHGYIESKFNVARMFMNGSSCGQVKRNYKVALLNLQELKGMGQDVDQEINRILASQEFSPQEASA